MSFPVNLPKFKTFLRGSAVRYLAMIILASSLPILTYADKKEVSCREEVGRKKAAEYVKYCIQISPATHPPCNDSNPCSMIVNEIKWGCKYAKETPRGVIPKFCDQYPQNSK